MTPSLLSDVGFTFTARWSRQMAKHKWRNSNGRAVFLGRIEGTIGAIGGCHITIEGPRPDTQQNFLNENRLFVMQTSSSLLMHVDEEVSITGGLARPSRGHTFRKEESHIFPSGCCHTIEMVSLSLWRTYFYLLKIMGSQFAQKVLTTSCR